MAKAAATTTNTLIEIKAPDIHVLEVRCVGTAPYVQNAFGAKTAAQMRAKQVEGDQAARKKARAAKDFNACYEEATHYSTAGWVGMPASAFRCAMISACRVAGVVMTQAKLCVFVEADGYDRNDGSPLVKIVGKREKMEMHVRLETGVPDIRARPMWREWSCVLRVRYDAQKFNAQSISNLLLRAGAQVGVGEGRPDSKKSAGMGWGTFTIEGTERAPKTRKKKAAAK